MVDDWRQNWKDKRRADAEKRREEIEGEATAASLIEDKGLGVYEEFLKPFEKTAAVLDGEGVRLRFRRMSTTSACLIISHHPLTSRFPQETEIHIRLDLGNRQIRLTSDRGGSETFDFRAPYGNVVLYRDGLPVRDMDDTCRAIMEPLLAAATAA
jgi:hypothetical protein